MKINLLQHIRTHGPIPKSAAICSAAFGVAVWFLNFEAFAQADYPSKPIRLVVAVAPGGGIDTASRMIADGLSPHLGQPVIIENNAGAAGNIGAGLVFNSLPDGYTLLGSSLTPITIADLLYKGLNFTPADFEPVAVMSRTPNVLMVRSDFPAKTMPKLIAHLKANPNKITYASAGVGTAAQLTMELFMRITGTELVHVPYKGTAPSLNDLVGGHVDLSFVQVAAGIDLHRQNRARILATATLKRLEFLPDVPTLAEAGIPGAESDTWNAISAPPKTPASRLEKLNAAVNQALANSKLQDRFRQMYVLPGGGDLQAVRQYVKDETGRWGGIIRSARIGPGGTGP